MVTSLSPLRAIGGFILSLTLGLCELVEVRMSWSVHIKYKKKKKKMDMKRSINEKWKFEFSTGRPPIKGNVI